ncbi:MAG: hypothetical protein FWE50_02505 [Alphaproteobacteria bacterium]|nr:hypothetical protein [Alphaproteobacteria bacterium]
MAVSQKTLKKPKPLVVPTLFSGPQMSKFFKKQSPEEIIDHVKQTENRQDLRYLSYSLDFEVLTEIVNNDFVSYTTLDRIKWTLENVPTMKNPKLLKLVQKRALEKHEEAKKELKKLIGKETKTKKK